MQRSVSSLSSRALRSGAAPFSGVRRPAAAVRTMASKAESIRQTVKDNKVVVYSKSYCPYCSEVKGLFTSLQVPALVIELDQTPDGNEVQGAFPELVGRSTVPQVFIGGKHIGGCDDTMAAYQAGKLKQLLSAVGYSI